MRLIIDKCINEHSKTDPRTFYETPIVIVYTGKMEYVAEYLLNVLNGIRIKIDKELPSPVRMRDSEYRKRRLEIEESGKHIIFLGKCHETILICKDIRKSEWDYNRCGMSFLSIGNKTVMLLEKMEKMDNLYLEYLDIQYEKASEDQNFKLNLCQPGCVEHFHYDCCSKFADNIREIELKKPLEAVGRLLLAILVTPLMWMVSFIAIEETLRRARSNLNEIKEMERMRYKLMIYNYLAYENALYFYEKV